MNPPSNDNINTEIYHQVLTELTVLANDAKTSLCDRDHFRFSTFIHNIRGVAGFYGEHRIAATGKAIEVSLARGNFAELETLLNALIDELDERMISMTNHRNP